MKQVTALLLNWKRPKNMERIIRCLKDQTADINIFLWNNNKKDRCLHKVDVKINCSTNFVCWPRWLMAGLARTEFIFTLDDDVIFTRPTVIQECIDFFRTEDLADDSILGIYGVILNDAMNYTKSYHIRRQKRANMKEVDIVKGRFMFTRRKFVQSLPMQHELPRGDDIYISSFSKHKYIPKFLADAWKDLPEGDVALYGQKVHKPLRQEAVNKYFESRNSDNDGAPANPDPGPVPCVIA